MSGPALSLWGRASSANVQKALWALEELGLAYERIPAGLSFGVNDGAEYRAMNPNGTVPTLRDGDLILWESDAILRHLARSYGRGGLWPTDPAAAAIADQWTTWTAAALGPSVLTLFHRTVRTPRAEQRLEGLETAAEAAARAVALLDAALEGRRFLAGDAFSFGEICPAIMARRALNLPWGAATGPNVARWLDRLSERPGYARWVDVPFGTCREEWDAHERAIG